MDTHTIPVTVVGFASTPAHGTLREVRWSSGDRFRRAGTALGICWGAALVGLFIPLAHLFLVPGFGLAGIVVFTRRVRREDEVRGAHGTCPDCGQEQDFEVPVKPAPRVATQCTACGRGLTIARED